MQRRKIYFEADTHYALEVGIYNINNPDLQVKKFPSTGGICNPSSELRISNPTYFINKTSINL